MKRKPIYRNFTHWFSTSPAHKMTSASRDWMREIWDDIYPTIEASSDDVKLGLLKLSEEHAERQSKLVTALFEYLKLYKKKNAPKFWRWYLDKELKND